VGVTDTTIVFAPGVSGIPDIDTVAINTIRASCMDAIQRADPGHPGTPMGVAPVAYAL
jgi:transketolase